MERSKVSQAIENLYAKLSYIMLEYADCIKRDDFFEIKRKLLGRVRQLEKEIDKLNMQQSEERLEKLYG